MTMPDDPRACRSPAELFGDAAADRRQLRKAYAALIKRYSPETHPDVFQHIHALYSQARDALRPGSRRRAPVLPPLAATQPPAPLDATPPVDEAPVAPAQQPDPLSWLAQQSPDTFPAALAELERRALADGDADLLRLVYACWNALEPERIPALLARLAARPATHHLLVELATQCLHDRPTQATDPAWTELADRLDDDHAARLLHARVGALVDAREPDAIAALFAAEGPRLRSGAPGAWADILVRVLDAAAYALDEAALDDAADALGRFDLPFDDADRVRLSERIVLVQSWRAAHADPAVPGLLLQALVDADGADAIGTCAVLRDLVEGVEDLSALLAHLQDYQPSLLAALHQLEVRVSGVEPWRAAWARWGRTPSIPLAVPARQVDGIDLGMPDPEQRAARWKVIHAHTRRRALAGFALAALIIAYPGWKLATAGGQDAIDGAGVVIVCALIGGATIGEFLGKRPFREEMATLRAPHHHPTAPQVVLFRAIEAMRARGLFTHELLGAFSLTQRQELDPHADALINHRGVNLLALSDGHLRAVYTRTRSHRDAFAVTGLDADAATDDA